MLTQLYIKNFAIIDQLELDIRPGMTSLTGETGAGKSILLDALGLVLGDRAEAGNVRHGADKADITAGFDIQALTPVQEQLSEADIEHDGECLIRRVISHEGRSKAFINGTPVTLQILRNIGKHLVDIHGQHEHQSLLKGDKQRQRLDDYGQHQQLLSECQSTYKVWKQAQQAFETLSQAEQQRNERLDLLRFQAKEFEELNLQENEWASIQDEHQRLAHAGQLIDTAQNILGVLSEQDDHNICQLLGQQQHALEQQLSHDSRLSPIAESLSTALIHAEEASSQLRAYADRLDIDPQRLQYLEDRIGQLHSTSRKHHCEPDALPQRWAAIQTELEQLENADATLAELQTTLEHSQQRYLDAATTLHKQRKITADSLSALVTDAMQNLGMEGGKLAIQVERDTELRAAHGQDRIEFQVSANPGQPMKALNKVASGGELSRISLAIQMITASCEQVPTLIFDEVDSGIGGGIAEVVGQHLRHLGQDRQVMCVTHLPQVASQAHQHFKVAKHKQQDSTHTGIHPLDGLGRIEEIARMLGGVEITQQTLRHAEEMIQLANNKP